MQFSQSSPDADFRGHVVEMAVGCDLPIHHRRGVEPQAAWIYANPVGDVMLGPSKSGTVAKSLWHDAS